MYVKFLRQFPSIPNEFGAEASAIGSDLELSFQPYKVHTNLTPYATWASALVQAVPRVQNRLELDTDWASNSTWKPLLVT